jgi:hypothetical protein
MRRYGRFVDMRVIHQRMDAKDVRIQRETARRQALEEALQRHAAEMARQRAEEGR